MDPFKMRRYQSKDRSHEYQSVFDIKKTAELIIPKLIIENMCVVKRQQEARDKKDYRQNDDTRI